MRGASSAAPVPRLLACLLACLLAALIVVAGQPAMAQPGSAVCARVLSVQRVRVSFHHDPRCRMRRAMSFELGRFDGVDPATMPDGPRADRSWSSAAPLLEVDHHRVPLAAIDVSPSVIRVCTGAIAPRSVRLYAQDGAGADVFYSTVPADTPLSRTCPGRVRLRTATLAMTEALPETLATMRRVRPRLEEEDPWSDAATAHRALLEAIPEVR